MKLADSRSEPVYHLEIRGFLTMITKIVVIFRDLSEPWSRLSSLKS